jgi:hypothetical protein
MKKLLALTLILAALFSLISCTAKEYEPVASTEEESRTVMTLSYGDKSYEVKYELYRAFFLTYKSKIDGGDATVWSSDKKDEYIARMNERIIDSVLEIYSTIALAESLGIDPYSAEIENEITEYVKIGVEGGDRGGVSYEGYETYEAYLESLKKLNLNYSVQTLLFRYSILVDMIDEYYLGEIDESDVANGNLSLGKLSYTKDDVLAFYNSDECVRLLRTYISEEMDNDPRARAERVRNAIIEAAKDDEDEVRDEMIGQGTMNTVPELEEGYVLGKYNLALLVYGDMVDEAFSLEVGEVSDVVTVHDGNQLLYYVLYRAEKSDGHFERNYQQISYIYLRHTVGSYYESFRETMKDSVRFVGAYDSIDHSAITMP